MATLVIFSISVLMPVVGFVFSVFIPLPILVYRAKLGRWLGVVVLLITIAVMGLVAGGLTMDVFFFSGLMLLGFSLSEMFEKELSVEMTVAAACGIVLATGLAAILVYSAVSNTGVIHLVSTYVTANLELSLKLYRDIGIPQETIDAISGSLDRIQYVLVRLLPSLAAASTLFVAWTNLIAARPIMARFGVAVPDFGRLNRWRAPDPLVWGVIGCGIIMLLPATGIRLIGLNGLMVLLTIYFIQGIAIVSFFFEKKKLPRPFRAALYTLIAFQQLLLLVIICIGLFDMWINFRKIAPDKNEPGLPS
jgi:uncharacterized protein YybS (DUF2232 family)